MDRMIPRRKCITPILKFLCNPKTFLTTNLPCMQTYICLTFWPTKPWFITAFCSCDPHQSRLIPALPGIVGSSRAPLPIGHGWSLINGLTETQQPTINDLLFDFKRLSRYLAKSIDWTFDGCKNKFYFQLRKA